MTDETRDEIGPKANGTDWPAANPDDERAAKIEELRGQAMDLYKRYGELAKQALELIVPTDKEIEEAADMVLGMYDDESTDDRTGGPIWDWDLFEQIVETRREAAEEQG